MSNVLIRDVAAEDLDQLRAAAADQGVSVQSLLRGAVHDHAAHLRRQLALVRTEERLRGRAAVPEVDRDAVLAATDRVHQERADRLSDRDVR